MADLRSKDHDHTKPQVLVIEDEKDTQEILDEILSKDFELSFASNGLEGFEQAKETVPSVILMDILMPKRDGFDTCAQIRQVESLQNVPVIMLSAMDNEKERTKAFNLGADDFIGKPFSKEELIARMRAKLRRSEASQKESQRPPSRFSVGNLEIDSKSYEVFLKGKLVPHISALEFRLLRFFLENPNRVLERKEILQSIWGNSKVSDRTVDTHVACLRKRIRGFSGRLCTIYGAGYILKPPPEEDDSVSVASS